MIIKRSGVQTAVVDGCHGGTGQLTCVEIFADCQRSEPGFKYCHDDLLEPGASIGEHRHEGDQEIYLILEGRGLMIEDGVKYPVESGDLCLTVSGHAHGIINSNDGPMRLLVVCTSLGRGSQ